MARRESRGRQYSLAVAESAIAAQPECEKDVVGDTAPQQYRSLKNHRLTLADRRIEALATPQDRSATGLQQAVQKTQQNALSSAVRSHDNGQRERCEAQRYIVENRFAVRSICQRPGNRRQERLVVSRAACIRCAQGQGLKHSHIASSPTAGSSRPR